MRNTYYKFIVLILFVTGNRGLQLYILYLMGSEYGDSVDYRSQSGELLR